MKKILATIFLTIIIFLTVLNTTFLIEISKDKELSNFYYKNIELSSNYSQKEITHMQEVKNLVNLSIFINLLVILITLILFKYSNLKTVGKVVISISLLLFIGAIFFQKFFHTFHLIIFNSNNWLLPATSTLIQNYPLTYFKDKFILINTINLIIGISLASSIFQVLHSKLESHLKCYTNKS
ncbi:DUF1461 domain-containing protein [archaeon]|nr:DUF1461 domain-containing protein [archaeon]